MSDNEMNDFFRQNRTKQLGNSSSSTIKTDVNNDTYNIDVLNALKQITNLLSNIQTILQPPTDRKYFSTAQTAVTVATPTRPENPDIIAGATGYDRIRVGIILGKISPEISVINDGNATIYIISSNDGKNWSTDENPILIGEARKFYNVYELRIRSSTAGNLTTLQGGIYRITEYEYSLAYTSTIIFNRTSLHIESVQNVAILGQQLPDITIPNGFSLAIRATQGNAGNIYIATTQARTQAAATRSTLSAGDTVELYITNANLVYISSSNGTEDVDLIVEQ